MSIKDSPPIVKLAILTLITVIIWITFDVYRALTIKPAPDVPEEILAKLDPSLDETALNQLQSRVYVADEQIRDNIINLNSGIESTFDLIEEIPLGTLEVEIPEASIEGEPQQ